MPSEMTRSCVIAGSAVRGARDGASKSATNKRAPHVGRVNAIGRLGQQETACAVREARWTLG
jgi:hypothetical protein